MAVTQLQTFKVVFIGIGILFVIGLGVMLTNVTEFETVDLQAEQIIEEDGQHYILHNDRKLKLNKGSLLHIDLHYYKTYKLTYSYNKLISGKGQVERLEAYGKTVAPGGEL